MTTKKTAKTVPAHGAPAEWTVMVYLAGDNSLSSAAPADLAEMKQVGSSEQLHVLAQVDRAGSKSSTTRYRLRKGTTLAADALEKLGETDDGDPAVLVDFLQWGVKNYPAAHHLVVIWNHGAGWDDSDVYQGSALGGAAPPVARKGRIVSAGRPVAGKKVPVGQARAAVKRASRALFSTTVAKMVKMRAIAFDDQAQDYLDNIELKNALAAMTKSLGSKIDIVGFDACLMSMAEVSYQIRNCALYTVGSQEEEPGDGWPYAAVLSVLDKRPQTSPEDLSKAIVQAYVASYAAGSGVTQSAVDLVQIGGVEKQVSLLGKALTPCLDDPVLRAAISAVRGQAQSYTAPYDEYVDLVDLCIGLSARVANAAVKRACQAVQTAVQKAVIASAFKGGSVAHSHGTSIYFPRRPVCSLYRTLDFAKGNDWVGFINKFVTPGTRDW